MSLAASGSRVAVLAGVVALIALAALLLLHFARPLWMPAYYKLRGRQTVEQVLARIGPTERARWRALFAERGLTYPPKDDVVILVTKAPPSLELWLDGDTPVFLRRVDVTAASGKRGPKLREGDRQVPEGVYRIEGLNPNSAFHLSMKLDYPNADDRRWARSDGREDLGGNIFIHGKASSVGCVAVGDAAIESLFTLVADLGRERVRVVIAPEDPREGALSAQGAAATPWLDALYERISAEFAPYQHRSEARRP